MTKGPIVTPFPNTDIFITILPNSAQSHSNIHNHSTIVSLVGETLLGAKRLQAFKYKY